MIDANKDFIEEASVYLGDENTKRVQKFYVSGLESFFPEPNKYDCIWFQWVLGYLKDNDLIELFKRCKNALKPNGLCIMKDNVSKSKVEYDEIDNCYTRPRQLYIDIIHKSRMHIILDDKQLNFPSELYDVRIIAFK